ncbi:MAG: hypothetical protein ACTHJN_17160 [Ginsengibacter sp.]
MGGIPDAGFRHFARFHFEPQSRKATKKHEGIVVLILLLASPPTNIERYKETQRNCCCNQEIASNAFVGVPPTKIESHETLRNCCSNQEIASARFFFEPQGRKATKKHEGIVVQIRALISAQDNVILPARLLAGGSRR